MTGPDHPSYSPIVAFGLRAQTVAFKAKTGQLRRGEADSLLTHHDALIPDDLPAHIATIAFIQRVADDPAGAADALLAFLSDWNADLSGAATEAALRDQAPGHFANPHFDWQDRKDAGLE